MKQLIFLLFPFVALAQVDPGNITIVRDEYGVPHVYSKTDAEAVYGMAWAQAEDNFHDMQTSLLAVRGLLGEVEGKKGAVLDAISFIIGARDLVEQQYEAEISPTFKKILKAYEQALNRYAELHPGEVRHKKLFPIEGKEALMTYVLNMTFLTNTQHDLLRILGNNFWAFDENTVASSSNGIAVSPGKTEDGKTYLVSNTHQPLTGPLSWYEVHVESEEGWSFLGATMPSAVTPLLGTNHNLGWTHTTNQDNFHDVFALEMHPKEKNKYLFDGEWLELEERTLKLKVKVGFMKIPIKRTFYRSVYGPTFQNKSGFFALRFPSNMVMAQAEQWYWMTKAQNFEEFKAALNRQQAANQNIIYADKTGRILFLNNGLYPTRNPDFAWQGVMEGDTSATLWPSDFLPIDSLVYIENPDCGYVFNMNNSPFDATCPDENVLPRDYPHGQSLLKTATARSIRFGELIEKQEQLSLAELKAIKYDSRYTFPMYTRTLGNMDLFRQLDPEKWPKIREAIAVLKKWDGSTSSDNKQAALIVVGCNYLQKYLKEKVIVDQDNYLPEAEYAAALQFAQEHLKKYFGTIEPPLGDVQKLVRGDKELPIWGSPEVLTQMYVAPYEKGKYQTVVGETYIMFATYTRNGLSTVETVVPFGSSNHPGNQHYDDQMGLFVGQRMKKMSLDKDVIYDSATKVYGLK